MLLACAIIVLGILFILPFVPGWRELRQNRDSLPLYIDMNYLKDPRYFAHSYRAMLKSTARSLKKLGMHTIILNQLEEIECTHDLDLPAGTMLNHLLDVQGTLRVGARSSFQKEVYSEGDCMIGAGTALQALLCDGTAVIGTGVKVFRWLDAEMGVRTEGPCDLGVSTTCGQEIILTQGCTFKRLYGFPVAVGMPSVSPLNPSPEPPASISDDIQRIVERNISDVPAHSKVLGNIISSDALTIGDHCAIMGDIKSHADLTVGSAAVITGNVFAEGDIRIGPGAWIKGIIFCQGSITLAEAVIVGSAGTVKSVVGKKGVSLGSGATIHGYVVTEGEGIVP